MSTKINLRIFTSLREVEIIWRTFEQHADCTVFQLFDWMLEWHNHIGSKQDLIPVIVLGFDDQDTSGAVGKVEPGTPIFIMPLAIENRSMIRRLMWLGSDLCDYNAPLLATSFPDLVESGEFGPVWQDIVDAIQADPSLHFNVFELEKMPAVVGSQPNPFLDLPVRDAGFSAHLVTLSDNWEQLYASKRSAPTRKRLRQLVRNLETHGEIRFVNVQEDSDRNSTLTKLIDQKRRSFARMGVPDIFTRPGYLEFYLAIASNPGLHDIIYVSRIDVGDVPAATGFRFLFKDLCYMGMSSYDEGLAKYSTGRLHLHEILKHAIEKKLRFFDFTIGDVPYKLDWADHQLQIFCYLEANTTRGHLIVGARSVVDGAYDWYNTTSLLPPSLKKAIGNSKRFLYKCFIREK